MDEVRASVHDLPSKFFRNIGPSVTIREKVYTLPGPIVPTADIPDTVSLESGVLNTIYFRLIFIYSHIDARSGLFRLGQVNPTIYC